MDESLESIWQEKMRQLPDEIIQRLELTRLQPRTNKVIRCLIRGSGAETMRAELLQRLPVAAQWKIFTDAPLDAFPAETFELVILLWKLSLAPASKTFKQTYQIVKTYGQCVLVTSFDGYPKISWRLLNKALATQQNRKDEPKINLRIYTSGLPENAQQLRRIFSKSGFNNIRVWEDGIGYRYSDGRRLFDDLVRLSPAGVFHQSVIPQIQSDIREKFCELFNEMKGLSKRTASETVSYPFAGAIGIK